MKFVADCMLGKLTRWLRILGYDTAYETFAEDDDLIAVSASEGRILLTRDGPLVRHAPKGTCLYIDYGNLDDQIAQMVVQLGISLDGEPFTRCLACNTPIRLLARADAKERVPDYIYKIQTTFFECPDCSQVYWWGTHVDRINERLMKIKNRVMVYQKEEYR